MLFCSLVDSIVTCLNTVMLEVHSMTLRLIFCPVTIVKDALASLLFKWWMALFTGSKHWITMGAFDSPYSRIRIQPFTCKN